MRKVLSVMMMLLLVNTAWAQDKSVTGKVTDENGNGLPGVNVLQKNTSNGSITDLDGNYKFTAPSGSILIFTYVGYLAQEVELGNQSVIDISMEVDAETLEEVVVTALGVERSKKALAYSVTEVDGSDLTEARETNVGNSLVGKIAGVNVAKTATGPAGSTRIVIRGNKALSSNNQPLYVIDGVPIDNSNLGSAGQWGGYDGGDGISSINPDDIEKISVLKGASAAALYGFRASNGVILITTKSGKKNTGINVAFNTNFVAEKAISFTDWQTEYGSGANGQKPATQNEAAEFQNASWGAKLDGSPVMQFDGVSRPYSYTGNAMDAFYQTGKTFTNTLTISGGGEAAQYRLSASDMNNESVMPNSGVDRTNLSTKLNFKLGKFSAAATSSYIVQEIKNNPSVSDGVFNANSIVRVFPTSLDVTTLKGDPNKLGAHPDTGTEYLGTNSVWWTNPYWVTHQVNKTHKKNRIMGNVRLRYDILDWLYVQARVGTDYQNIDQFYLEPYGHGFKPTGGMTMNFRTETETNTDFMLGGKKKFGDFNIDAFVGSNQLRRKSQGESFNGQGFAIPFFHYYGNATSQSAGFSTSDWGVNSVYYQTELSYLNSIYVTATGRKDWFSVLDGRSIFYPSVGVSAVISDLLDVPATDFLKFRATWGQVGGANIGPYSTSFNYGLGSPHLGQAVGGIGTGNVPNRLLVPYLSTELELGLDVRFFEGRLGFDFAYYDQKTEDDILNSAITISSGYSGATLNVGEIANNGVELLITGVPIKQADFEWTTSFNFAQNNNKVVSLVDPDNDEEFIQGGGSRTLTSYIRHEEGYPSAQVYGYEYSRDASGNIILDANGLPERNPDMVRFGTGVAPTTGGWNNEFRYRNFNMAFLIDYKFGGVMHSGTNAVAYQLGLHKATLEGRTTGLGEVLAEDINDYYGRIGGQIAEPFIYKSDFIKFRQLTIGYNVPRSVLNKTPFKSLSLSFVGRNLLILHKAADNIDPESTYDSGNDQGIEYMGMPSSRTFGFNLNAKF